MGKKSRDKGANGEREVIKYDDAYGFRSQRTAPLQAGYGDEEWDDVRCTQYPLSAFRREVKRYAKVPLGRFATEYLCDKEAPAGFMNALVTRSDNEPWIISMKYEDFLKCMKAWQEASLELDNHRSPF